MTRRLFTAASALSLLLCGASVVLWVRSYNQQDDRWMFAALGGRRLPVLSQGRIHFFRLYDSSPVQNVALQVHYEGWPLYGKHVVEVMPRTGGWRWGPFEEIQGQLAPPRGLIERTAGNALLDVTVTSAAPFKLWVVPYWPLPLLCLILPLWLFIGHAVRCHREQTGLCPACGYDLRASAGRCPECGTAIPLNAGTPT